MQAKIIPVTELRPKMLKCITNAQKLGQEYVVTKNGKPSAVLVGFDEWESMKETLEILSKPQLVKRIKKNLDYFKRGGKGKTIKEVFGE
ncbi:MAG: type II toxin-antitoxin system Phd/YefM family antitoxin [Deltaproteobacteria bacterium]|nr:type II toxin-antitoxin system Phd/YefM family antitoxin [Deltaproteobacteria bacterium]